MKNEKKGNESVMMKGLKKCHNCFLHKCRKVVCFSEVGNVVVWGGNVV